MRTVRSRWVRETLIQRIGDISTDFHGRCGNGDLLYTFTRPWSDGTTGITLSPSELLEKLAALVPLPRVHLIRYGGCLAPHSQRRGAIIPTPRQQGVDGHEATTGTAHWSWARLLGRVFALDMATCPFCRQGALRMIAAITQAEVIRKLLRHLKRAADPPPIAPARARQATFDWVASAQPARVDAGATCAQRRGVSPRCACAIPFAIALLQPFHVARLAAVPPGHPCGAPLTHPESPVQHQPKCAVRRGGRRGRAQPAGRRQKTVVE
jgi:hypothetical protein